MQPAHWRWAKGPAWAPWILAALLLLPLQVESESNQQECSLPKPRNVHFISRNMAAVVHWFPPLGLGDGALYSVQYRMYGPDTWQYKLECTNINRTWCDLTNETYDYEEQYYARVMVAFNGGNCSKWARTDRFSPTANTKIDPPIVRLSSGDRFISINLSSPEKWKRNPKDKSLYQIFPLVEFKVSILNTKTKSEWNLSGKNSFLNVTKLDPNSTYCVTAESYIPGPYGTSQPSKTVCATTLADNTESLMLILFGYVLPAVVAVLLTSAMSYAAYKYIHVDEPKSPTSLQQLQIERCREKFLTPEINNFISIIVMSDSHPPWKNQDWAITQNGSTVGKVLEELIPQVQHSGYLLQSPELASGLHEGPSYNRQQPCLGASSGCDPESQSTLSSETYGLVLRASNSAPVQEQNYRIQNGMCPADIAYRSQVSTNLPGERTHELDCPQQTTMQLGISPVTTNVDPSINNFLQTQTEAKADEGACNTIVLDWDCRTGRLNIPSLYDLDIEPDEEEGQICGECDQHPGDGLLSKVYVKQASQESTEEEDLCLLQFSGKWDLHIQM
ncbi:interleukin-20 receptor subunit alpha-like [Lissotriton helveticus]